MKYIIIGYTNDIDIKSNTAKIKYLHCDHTGFYKYDFYWVDELDLATTFDYREDAQEIIDQYDYLNKCIIYRIEVSLI